MSKTSVRGAPLGVGRHSIPRLDWRLVDVHLRSAISRRSNSEEGAGA